MSSDPVNPIRPEFLDKLDPQFVEIYNREQAPKLRADQVTIEEYRANPTKYTLKIAPGPYPDVGSADVYNVKVDQPDGQIKVKVYIPTENAAREGALKSAHGFPAHVNYHGGGWVIGGLQSDESWCRQACQNLGMIIVDVDYRLAPVSRHINVYGLIPTNNPRSGEYAFPASIWDSWAALKWVFANADRLNIDKSRVSIGGLSAGGHLCAVMALMARDDPAIPPLKLQILVVPSVDARWTPLEGSADPAVPYETYKTCEFAPCLPLQRMRWFMKLWLGSDPEVRKKKTNQWIASPILAESHANLAPSSIHCAEFDVLRDEAIAYNELLNDSGTPSRVKVYKGVCHPWGHWDGELEKAKDYVRSTLADLKQAHSIA